MIGVHIMSRESRAGLGFATQVSLLGSWQRLPGSELGLAGWEVVVWLFVACAAVGLLLSVFAKA